MLVRPDRIIEVAGASGVTVVNASLATLSDGALGVSISGIRLCYLESGDAFDPKASRCMIHPDKPMIVKGKENNRRNGILADLCLTDAVTRSITEDLVNNAADAQLGLLIAFKGQYVHGYAFTFSKTEETRGYLGLVKYNTTYAAHGVRLDVRPVCLTLGSAKDSVPLNIEALSSREAIQSVTVRAILLVDPDRLFHPARPLSRAKLARAVVRASGVVRPQGPLPVIADVTETTRLVNNVNTVVAAGLMDLDEGTFRPEQSVTRREVESALTRALRVSEALGAIDIPHVYSGVEPGPPEATAFVPPTSNKTRLPTGSGTGPLDPASREDVAVALYQFLGCPGADP